MTEKGKPDILRQLLIAVLAIVTVTGLGSLVLGAWGPAGCLAVASPAPAPLGWYKSTSYPGQWAYWDGKDYSLYFRPSDQAVSWKLKSGDWSPYVDLFMVEEHYGTAPEPEGSQGVVYTGPLPTGVDWSEVSKCPAGYYFNGQEIDRQTAMALATEGLPENLDKPWLVAIGDESFLKTAAQVFEQVPGAKVCRQQLYSPDDWAVERFELEKNRAFAATGKAVLLMMPGDSNSEQRVVHLQYDLNDGAVGLAKVFAAFDPNKVPDLRSPVNIGWPDWVPPSLRNWQTLALIGVVVYFLLFQYKKEN